MPDHEALRVLIVAGDLLARAGLAANLANQPGLTVVGQIGLDPDLAKSIEAYRPGALVWDLGWDMNASLELIAGLHLEDQPENRSENPPVLVLLPDASRASDAWVAGARGLLLRYAGPDRIYSGLLSLRQGLVVMDPGLAASAPVLRSPPTDPGPILISRVTQALKLLAEGLSNKTMADRLGISENTVKFHVNSIMGKLGARSRTEALSLAIRAGLILI